MTKGRIRSRHHCRATDPALVGPCDATATSGGRVVRSLRPREVDAVDDVDGGVGGLDVAADDLGRAVDREGLAAPGNGQIRAFEGLVGARERGWRQPARDDVVGEDGREQTLGVSQGLGQGGLVHRRERAVGRGEDRDVLGRVERVAETGRRDRGDQRLEGRVVGGGGRHRILGHAGEAAGTVGRDRCAGRAERGVGHHGATRGRAVFHHGRRGDRGGDGRGDRCGGAAAGRDDRAGEDEAAEGPCELLCVHSLLLVLVTVHLTVPCVGLDGPPGAVARAIAVVGITPR